MPKLTIDGRTVEVEAGTNLIEAGLKVGVHIPHYCYHPRLSVVGQCRMCLVEVDGSPKLAAACATPVTKDGMVVSTDSEAVQKAQDGMMEFFLVNHPLDCPICDQAGECGLQDYSFKHGQAFSRYQYEDKRTYPGRERIPLGPNVLLNMNRCIQCTRCIRFTQEVSKTGELGFFNRGGRTEIGVFPDKVLDNELSANVVDICPVGALTSTRFRFAERVWYLAKEPSLCTGCDVGCNVTLEHRKGQIRRYKPRHNPAVNDYWMCDYGRGSWERYQELPRLSQPRVRPRVQEERGFPRNASWSEALDLVHQALSGRRGGRSGGGGAVALLASGNLTTEEAFLLQKIADRVGTPHVALAGGPGSDRGPTRTIPNPNKPDGAISGDETTPNRRGAELAGLGSSAELARREGATGGTIDAPALLEGDAASRCDVLLVADSDFGPEAHRRETVERLRRAGTLIVMGWADTELARMADVALPTATHAEREGTFVNVERRLQRFERAFPPPAQVRPAVEALADLYRRFDGEFAPRDVASVWRLMLEEVGELSGLPDLAELPATGVELGGADGRGGNPDRSENVEDEEEATGEAEAGDAPASATGR